LKLQSDFNAFNPDALLNSMTSNPCNSPSSTMEDVLIDSPVPLGETRPLEMTLDTCGEWEVCGSTPETSSNASGFSAARNGFRPGELFTCKIYVKMDYFEIFLNNVCLSLSEHMVPVSFIQSIVIEGDCRISKMFFGETKAVETKARQATLCPLPPRLPSLKNLTQLNLEEASIVECICREPIIEMDDINSLLNLDDPIFPVDEHPIANGHDNRTSSIPDLLNTPPSIPTSRSLLSLHRAESYQLVFDVSDGEEDEKEPSPLPPINRASSCLNLQSTSSGVIKRPSLLIPPKPVPPRYSNLQKLLPNTNDSSRIKRPIRAPQTTPTQGPPRPLMARTGYAIKVTHPAIQIGGDSATKTSIPRPNAAAMPTSLTLSQPPGRSTKDFENNGQRIPRLSSARPAHLNQPSSGPIIRRRSIPLSIS
uniref:Galectin n=1 Tax=Rodentolepis nana TaxID=102285 RepID=A0A0R3T3J5_RODNA